MVCTEVVEVEDKLRDDILCNQERISLVEVEDDGGSWGSIQE